MTSKVKADEFLDLVKRSGLVELGDLSQALSNLDQPLGESGIIGSSLIKAGVLTEWQTERLLEGRHRGFFVGKYKVLDHIGSGGMGSVYLAEHRLMRHRVAIKVLPKSRVDESTYLDRFRQEARAAAMLNHPNVVRAFDIDNDGDLHYLVMEFVDGEDIQKIVALGGPLDFRLAADYARQAALGLDHAHQHGLVHRDVKPSNLLVDRQGVVKVLDLGLARLDDSSQAPLTMAAGNDLLGTADYLSPEQALNSHDVDHRADIYSLGCTLYFMLTGRPPFPDGTLAQRILNHQMARPPGIRKVRPDAPDGLLAICHRMLGKKPADRQSTAGEVARELEAYLTGQPLVQPTNIVHSQSSLGRADDDEDLDFAPPESRVGTRSVQTKLPSPATKAPQSELRLAESVASTVSKRAPPSVPPPTTKSDAPPAPALADLFADLPPVASSAAPPPTVDSLAAMEPLSTDGLSLGNLGTMPSLPGGDFLTRPSPQQPQERPGRRAAPSSSDEDGPAYSLWLTIAAGVVIGVILVAVGISYVRSFSKQAPPDSVEFRNMDDR